MQKFIGIGNLTEDPKVVDTKIGKVTKIYVAFSEGKKEDSTVFFTVACFDKLAENVAKYTNKGKKVYVEGVITTRKYTDDQGVNRRVYEICASRVEFLSFGDRMNSELPNQVQEFTKTEDDDLPF